MINYDLITIYTLSPYTIRMWWYDEYMQSSVSLYRGARSRCLAILPNIESPRVLAAIRDINMVYWMSPSDISIMSICYSLGHEVKTTNDYSHINCPTFTIAP